MRSYIRTGTMAYSGYDRMGRTSKAGRRAFGSSSTDLDALKGGRHWGNTQLTHNSQHQASIQARKKVSKRTKRKSQRRAQTSRKQPAHPSQARPRRYSHVRALREQKQGGVAHLLAAQQGQTSSLSSLGRLEQIGRGGKQRTHERQRG